MSDLKLQTSRLILVPICESDWPFFLQLYRDLQVMRYISEQVSDAVVRSHFESRLQQWHTTSTHWLCLTVVEKKYGHQIGTVGLRPRQEPTVQAELGYKILPSWQGQGFASEAVNAVLDFALNTCRFHKITATVTAGNDASVKLLEKLGFKKESCLRDNYRLNGLWYDDLKFGLYESERPQNQI